MRKVQHVIGQVWDFTPNLIPLAVAGGKSHYIYVGYIFCLAHFEFTIKLETLTVLRKVSAATSELRQLCGQFWSGSQLPVPRFRSPIPNPLTSDEIKYVTQFHMRISARGVTTVSVTSGVPCSQ